MHVTITPNSSSDSCSLRSLRSGYLNRTALADISHGVAGKLSAGLQSSQQGHPSRLPSRAAADLSSFLAVNLTLLLHRLLHRLPGCPHSRAMVQQRKRGYPNEATAALHQSQSTHRHFCSILFYFRSHWMQPTLRMGEDDDTGHECQGGDSGNLGATLQAVHQYAGWMIATRKKADRGQTDRWKLWYLINDSW